MSVCSANARLHPCAPPSRGAVADGVASSPEPVKRAEGLQRDPRCGEPQRCRPEAVARMSQPGRRCALSCKSIGNQLNLVVRDQLTVGTAQQGSNLAGGPNRSKCDRSELLGRGTRPDGGRDRAGDAIEPKVDDGSRSHPVPTSAASHPPPTRRRKRGGSEARCLSQNGYGKQ